MSAATEIMHLCYAYSPVLHHPSSTNFALIFSVPFIKSSSIHCIYISLLFFLHLSFTHNTPPHLLPLFTTMHHQNLTTTYASTSSCPYAFTHTPHPFIKASSLVPSAYISLLSYIPFIKSQNLIALASTASVSSFFIHIPHPNIIQLSSGIKTTNTFFYPSLTKPSTHQNLTHNSCVHYTTSSLPFPSPAPTHLTLTPYTPNPTSKPPTLPLFIPVATN